MTKHELRQMFYISKEIQRLIQDRDNLERGSIVPSLDGMPKGSSTSDRTGRVAVEMAYIREKIDLKVKELFIERARLEGYIEGIEDSALRLIFRLRHVNCLSWEQIGAEMGYSEGHVRKIYRGYWTKKL